MPSITELLDTLRGNSEFSVIDINSAFWQIKNDDRTSLVFSFRTPKDQYRMLRLPFGAMNSPATWLRLMDKVLKGLKSVKVFMDDITVFTKTKEEHLDVLDQLMGRLCAAGLTFKPDKVTLLASEVRYLGHVISAEGTRPDERKLEAIQNSGIPKCVKDVQSFLEMANYYCEFVRDFSEIAYPLTRLTRKGIEFQWTEEEHRALDELEARLSSSEVMRFPHFTQPFKLYTDATLVAAGAVLCQDFPDGERPIAYYSKTLQPPWTRYSAVEREMLAILLSVRKFRFYI